jgi:hypothetical protein
MSLRIFLAPLGAKACSLGRQPQGRRPPNSPEPRRGDGRSSLRGRLPSPGALEFSLGLSSWGSRPRLHASAPSGAGFHRRGEMYIRGGRSLLDSRYGSVVAGAPVQESQEPGARGLQKNVVARIQLDVNIVPLASLQLAHPLLPMRRQSFLQITPQMPAYPMGLENGIQEKQFLGLPLGAPTPDGRVGHTVLGLLAHAREDQGTLRHNGFDPCGSYLQSGHAPKHRRTAVSGSSWASTKANSWFVFTMLYAACWTAERRSR